jgi:hypothetical protein
MNDLGLAGLLFVGGFIMHRIMYTILSWHPRWEGFLGNKGEVEAGKETTPEIKFTPEQQKVVDHVVETRLARERSKFADYEDLAKFKQEQLQKQDKHAQEELEKSKKYEEAKKLYEGQITQTKELVSKKDAEIQGLRINHALINEISKQNGYSEETLALIKDNAVLDANGSVTIKGKDANGMDVQLPVSEGIKRFLEARPYLIKSTHKQGAGSSGGTPPPAGADLDLNTLNSQLAEALNRKDYTKTKELNAKIRGQLQSKGVTI